MLLSRMMNLGTSSLSFRFGEVSFMRFSAGAMAELLRSMRGLFGGVVSSISAFGFGACRRLGRWCC